MTGDFKTLSDRLMYGITDYTNMGRTFDPFAMVTDEQIYKINPQRYGFYMQLLDSLKDPNNPLVKVLTAENVNRAQRDILRDRIKDLAKELRYQTVFVGMKEKDRKVLYGGDTDNGVIVKGTIMEDTMNNCLTKAVAIEKNVMENYVKKVQELNVELDKLVVDNYDPLEIWNNFKEYMTKHNKVYTEIDNYVEFKQEENEQELKQYIEIIENLYNEQISKINTILANIQLESNKYSFITEAPPNKSQLTDQNIKETKNKLYQLYHNNANPTDGELNKWFGNSETTTKLNEDIKKFESFNRDNVYTDNPDIINTLSKLKHNYITLHINYASADACTIKGLKERLSGYIYNEQKITTTRKKYSDEKNELYIQDLEQKDEYRQIKYTQKIILAYKFIVDLLNTYETQGTLGNINNTEYNTFTKSTEFNELTQDITQTTDQITNQQHLIKFIKAILQKLETDLDKIIEDNKEYHKLKEVSKYYQILQQYQNPNSSIGFVPLKANDFSDVSQIILKVNSTIQHLEFILTTLHDDSQKAVVIKIREQYNTILGDARLLSSLHTKKTEVIQKINEIKNNINILGTTADARKHKAILDNISKYKSKVAAYIRFLNNVNVKTKTTKETPGKLDTVINVEDKNNTFVNVTVIDLIKEQLNKNIIGLETSSPTSQSNSNRSPRLDSKSITSLAPEDYSAITFIESALLEIRQFLTGDVQENTKRRSEEIAIQQRSNELLANVANALANYGSFEVELIDRNAPAKQAVAQQKGGTFFSEKLEQFEAAKKAQNDRIMKDVADEVKMHPIYGIQSLAVSRTDRLIFIAFTFILRGLTLFLIDWGINSYYITSFQQAFSLYIGIYITLFFVWVLLTNSGGPDENLFFKVLFYYINYHENGPGRILVHLVVQLFMLPLPFLVKDKVFGVTQQDSSTFEQRRSMYRVISMISFFTWVTTSLIALQY